MFERDSCLSQALIDNALANSWLLSSEVQDRGTEDLDKFHSEESSECARNSCRSSSFSR